MVGMSDPSTPAPLPDPVKTRPVIVKLTIAVMIAALFVGFLIQNNDKIDIDFLGWTGSMSLSVVLVSSAIAGVVVWELAGYLRRRKR